MSRPIEARVSGAPRSVHLRGRPRSIEGLLSIEPERAPERVLLRSRGEPSREPVPMRWSPFAPGLYRLRVKLSPTTPPGEREVQLDWDGRLIDARLTIEPDPHTRVVPGSFSLAAAPGSTSELQVTVWNEGNVPLEITKAHVFAIMPVHILGDAMWSTYQSEARGNDRVGRFADELAERYAQVRLVVRPGRVRLDPGELRSLELEVKWPDKMQPGVEYRGLWPIGGFNVGFSVQVEGIDVEGAPTTRRSPK